MLQFPVPAVSKNESQTTRVNLMTAGALARASVELAEVAHGGPVGVNFIIEVLLAAKDTIHVLISKSYVLGPSWVFFALAVSIFLTNPVEFIADRVQRSGCKNTLIVQPFSPQVHSGCFWLKIVQLLELVNVTSLSLTNQNEKGVGLILSTLNNGRGETDPGCQRQPSYL